MVAIKKIFSGKTLKMLSVYTTIKNKIEQKASISIILYSSKSSTCHREMDGNSLASMNVDGVMRAHRMYVYLCTSLSLWMYVCVCTERSTEWTSEWVSLRTLHWTIDKTSNKYIKTEYYWCKPNLTFFPIQIMPYESSAYCKQKKKKAQRKFVWKIRNFQYTRLKYERFYLFIQIDCWQSWIVTNNEFNIMNMKLAISYHSLSLWICHVCCIAQKNEVREEESEEEIS